MDCGGTANAALVVIGDELGLYRALADHGPLTPDELAARTTTAEPYVREWLGAQAASGFACDGPPSYDARRRAITSRYSYRYSAGPSCEPLFAPMANSRKSRSRAAARSGESANAA